MRPELRSCRRGRSRVVGAEATFLFQGAALASGGPDAATSDGAADLGGCDAIDQSGQVCCARIGAVCRFCRTTDVGLRKLRKLTGIAAEHRHLAVVVIPEEWPDVYLDGHAVIDVDSDTGSLGGESAV